MTNRNAFRTWATALCLAALALLPGCSPKASKHFGAVVDNTGGIKANASGLDLNGKKASNAAAPTATADLTTKAYVDGRRFDQIAQATADTTFGDGTKRISGVGDPTSAQDVATKNWIEQRFSPLLGFQFFDDFQANGTGATLSTSTPSPGGWIAVQSGTAAAISYQAVSSDKETGQLFIDAGTTTTGNAAVVCGTIGGGGCAHKTPTSGRFVFDAKVQLLHVSDGTNTFVFTAGDADVVDTTNLASNAIRFNVDSNSNTHWQIETCAGGCSGGTQTITPTSIVANAAQWYHLRWEDVGGTVTFFIDGASVGTISTNVPSTAFMMPSFRVRKTAGTTANQCVALADWIGIKSNYSRAN